MASTLVVNDSGMLAHVATTSTMSAYFQPMSWCCQHSDWICGWVMCLLTCSWTMTQPHPWLIRPLLSWMYLSFLKKKRVCICIFMYMIICLQLSCIKYCHFGRISQHSGWHLSDSTCYDVWHGLARRIWQCVAQHSWHFPDKLAYWQPTCHLGRVRQHDQNAYHWTKESTMINLLNDLHCIMTHLLIKFNVPLCIICF